MIKRPELTSSPLLAAIRENRSFIAHAAIFSALLNILYISPSLYMLQVYDRVVPTQGYETLALLSLIFAYAIITLAILDFARSRILVKFADKIETALITQVILATVRGVQRRGRSGSALRDLDGLKAVLGGSGVLAFFDIPWTPIYLIVAFLLHPLLGLFTLICLSILIVMSFFNERGVDLTGQKSLLLSSQFYGLVDGAVAQADVVKALGMERGIAARVLFSRRRLAEHQLNSTLNNAGYASGIKAMRLLMQSFALGIGAFLAISGRISPGTIFAASLVLSRALAPVESITYSWRGLTQARHSYESLGETLNSMATPGAYAPEPAVKNILLEQVTTVSPVGNRPILQGLDLSIATGEIVAIVGASGSGKSTLLRTICGIQAPVTGSVRIGGVPVVHFNDEARGGLFGYVDQDANLLTGTVLDNITRFRGDGSNAKALEAAAFVASQVGIHEAILELADGYQTWIGKSGISLSRGQQQQLAIARAIYGMPNIVLLDEPNSALDTASEARLAAVIRDLKAKKRTVIIATHQTRMLEICDKILMLRDGKIFYFGPRDETVRRISLSGAASA